ncbi:MAG: VOC family protein [Pseudobdellovibrionaceae bacterium]
MEVQIAPSHVAILVPSVRKAADYLRQFNFQIGPEEEWDSEGTREIYVEKDKGNSLLLMETIKPGAYQRSLEKRGPGLHHLAIDVLNLEKFIGTLSGSGWLLHPSSIESMKHVRTVYLARPGFPGLIEVQEKERLHSKSLFVNGVHLQSDSQPHKLVQTIGLSTILNFSPKESLLVLNNEVILLKSLY